jgi:hypothetical protein
LTRRDAERELWRERARSLEDRIRDQGLRDQRWRDELGRDLKPGEAFLCNQSGQKPGSTSRPPTSGNNRGNRPTAQEDDPIQRHHSDPVFAGGEPNQPRTDMARSAHQRLHTKLNRHLRNRTDEQGNDMSPRRGNSGRDIRRNFDREELIEEIDQFYRNNLDEFPAAARDFFNQHCPPKK